MRTLAIITLLLLVLCGQAQGQTRPAPRKALHAYRTNLLPANADFFIAIGRCEQPAPADKRIAPPSKRNPWGLWKRGYEYGVNWHHPGPSYPGGLGVWAPLWYEQGIKGTDLAPSPDKATPAEQMIHAQRIVKRYGLYAWGCTGRAMAVAPPIL